MADELAKTIEYVKAKQGISPLSLNCFFSKPRTQEELDYLNDFLTSHGQYIRFISLGNYKITDYNPKLIAKLISIIRKGLKFPIYLSIYGSNLGNAKKDVLLALRELDTLPLTKVDLSGNNIGTPLNRATQDELELTTLITSLLKNKYLRIFDIGGNELYLLKMQCLEQIFKEIAAATKLKELEMGGCGLGFLNTRLLLQLLQNLLAMKNLKKLTLRENGLNLQTIKWTLLNATNLEVLNISGNSLHKKTTPRDWKELSCVFLTREVRLKELEIGGDLDRFFYTYPTFLYQSYLEFLHVLQSKGVLLTRGGKSIELPIHKEIPAFSEITALNVSKSCRSYFLQTQEPEKQSEQIHCKKPLAFWVNL